MALFRLPAESALAVVLASIRKDGILLLANQKLVVTGLKPVQVLTAVYLSGVLLPCLVTALTIGREMGRSFAVKLMLRQAVWAAGFQLGDRLGGLLFWGLDLTPIPTQSHQPSLSLSAAERGKRVSRCGGLGWQGRCANDGGIMKAVVIGEGRGASMAEIMAVYPRHKVIVDAATARGEVIGIGPLMDGGNMAIRCHEGSGGGLCEGGSLPFGRHRQKLCDPRVEGRAAQIAP